MARYLKIQSSVAVSCNKELKAAIRYIGKRNIKRVYKGDRKNENDFYFERGIDYLAKKIKSKRVIRRMIKPEGKKDSKVWYYSKAHYGKTYRIIILILLKNLRDDRENVTELLNTLYEEFRKTLRNGNEPERTYSDTLVYWQKIMLDLRKDDLNASIDDRDNAGKILDCITKVDRMRRLP